VALTNGAGAQKLVITNSGNLTAGVITADTVDTTGVTGTVVLTGTMLNSSGTAFTGGSGNTTLEGSAAADSIVTGIGTDTIVASTGDDFISTGAGNDVINLGVGANVVDAGAENDNIISVTDIALLSVINGGTGTDTLILSGAAGATDILTVSPLNLVENIVLTGASPTPSFAGAALTGKSIVLSEVFNGASTAVTYVIAAGNVINLSGITTAVGTAGQGGAATTALLGASTVTVGAGATVTGPAAYATTFNGTTGAETMTGGSAIDTFNAGAGRDIMTGGAGADVFRFSTLADHTGAAGVDVKKINDFTTTSDKINFGIAGSGGNATIQGLTLVPGTTTAAAFATGITDATSVATIADVYTAIAANAAFNVNANFAVSAATAAGIVAKVITFTTGAAAGQYLVVNDSTAAFQAADDIVIQVVGTVVAGDLSFTV
jgi:Ca2+-binding RTX toxin-like protein